MIFIATNLDASNNNLGKLELEEKKLDRIDIIGEENVTGMTSSYKAMGYYDDGSSEDITSSVEWSITNGSEYASIYNGLVSILKGASSNSIEITALKDGISYKKNVIVTYKLIISSETEEVISGYGCEQLSDEKKLALDSFINEFNTRWSDKVECLILPILCGEKKVYNTVDELNLSPALYNIKSKTIQEIVSQIYSENAGRLQTTENGFESISPVIANFSAYFQNIPPEIQNSNSHCVLLCSKEWCSGFAGSNSITKNPKIDSIDFYYGLSNYSLNKGSGDWYIIDNDKNICGYSVTSGNDIFGYNQNVKTGIENADSVTSIGLIKATSSATAEGWIAGISFGVGFDTKEEFDKYCDSLYALYKAIVE